MDCNKHCIKLTPLLNPYTTNLPMTAIPAHHLPSQVFELHFRQCLGKNISQILFCVNMMQCHCAYLVMVTDEMKTNINMLISGAAAY